MNIDVLTLFPKAEEDVLLDVFCVFRGGDKFSAMYIKLEINRLEQGIKGGYISLFDQFDYFVVRCHFIPVYY